MKLHRIIVVLSCLIFTLQTGTVFAQDNNIAAHQAKADKINTEIEEIDKDIENLEASATTVSEIQHIQPKLKELQTRRKTLSDEYYEELDIIRSLTPSGN